MDPRRFLGPIDQRRSLEDFEALMDARRRLQELERVRQLCPRGKAATAASKADGYEQSESFSLMEYGCKHGHRFIVWNSRPHITPFVIGCRVGDCNAEAAHDRWGADAYAPFHVPEVGDWIFIDVTPDVARRSAREKVAAWWNDPRAPLAHAARDWFPEVETEVELKDRCIQRFAETTLEEWGGHGPHLEEVTPERRERLVRESATRRQRRECGLPLGGGEVPHA